MSPPVFIAACWRCAYRWRRGCRRRRWQWQQRRCCREACGAAALPHSSLHIRITTPPEGRLEPPAPAEQATKQHAAHCSCSGPLRGAQQMALHYSKDSTHVLRDSASGAPLACQQWLGTRRHSLHRSHSTHWSGSSTCRQAEAWRRERPAASVGSQRGDHHQAGKGSQH